MNRLVAAAVVAATANAQFLSVFKSSSWVQGEDGQMHEQTHEVKTDVTQDANGMTKLRWDVRCIDGDCQAKGEKVREVVAAPPGMFAGFAGLNVEERRPQQDIVMGEAHGMVPMLPIPRLAKVLREFVSRQAPSRSFLHVEMVKPVVVTDVVPEQDGDVARSDERATSFVFVAALLVGFGAMSLLVKVVQVVRGLIFGASAREVRDLAEPLAATEHAQAAVPPAAAKVATESAALEEQEEPRRATEAPFQFRPSVGTWLVHVDSEA